jgi:arginine/lysine/ornithine decarboxylase
MDPLQVFVDISGLRITGYRAADWLRAHRRVNLHLCDHRRISAQLTYADDDTSAERLLTALRDLARHAERLPAAAEVDIPSPADMRLEQAMPPRDAFFGPVEQVPWKQAAGRVAAAMLTPYPPGIPAALPGERLNAEVVDYLRSGVDAGMVIPDAADNQVGTIRVAIEN